MNSLKRMRFVLVSFLISTTLLFTCISVSAETYTLNVTPKRQEKSMWCWAATTQMIVNFLGTWNPTPTQTQIVKTVMGIPEDEDAPNVGATDFEMTTALNSYMVSTTQTSRISFPDVKEMINGWNSPIETSIAWTNGSGRHAQVIYGYEQNGTWYGLYVIDPKMEGMQHEYYGFDEYKLNADFSWRATWYNNKHA